MEAKTDEDTYIFQPVEQWRRGQRYFLHQQNRQKEAEKWLNDCFNGLLQKYGANKCKSILEGEGHLRQDKQVQMSPKISTYLEGLHLWDTVKGRFRDDYL